ncbi:hypothetical protein KPH14_004131 [Odynerus spinipes]|uniref:C2H2-type domain-containing protein n=1 Tax=Odynerus spinipes TaxID=1348599 RepID=A0AAD9RZJ8_9HYME|nr:hypothetical protein KPH14_004131 [Odynerus spinipes]
MAYTSLPRLVDVNRLQSDDVEKMSLSLSEVLQSDPVRRLLNQPNIIIKTIPVSTQPKSSITNANIVNISMNVIEDKNNGIVDTDLHKIKQSEVLVLSKKSTKKENTDDENLLPSKSEGKSEISLLPIQRKRKECGHYGPCENITCDVTIEQCIDQDGISLMLACNIEEHEINAPVWKHCKSNFCDALSIDHDRCRRAIIKVHRFDKSKICDICGLALKTRKSRVRHKNCRRQNEYRHNTTDGAQVLKERMRERELQMLEDAKTKKQDYMDPIAGYNRAMDSLRKNEELIIIPKTRSPQHSAVTITSPSNSQANQQINYANNISGKYLPNIPLVFPPQNIVFGKNSHCNENNVSQVKLPHTLNSKLATNTSAIALQNQLVKFTNASQTSLHSLPLNDWLLSQSHVVTTSSLHPKPILTPIRVVPITNLITQPSLLHQTQGIPKFCIMADNSIPPLTVSDIQPIIPSKPVDNSNVVSKENPKQELQKRKKGGIKRTLRKRIRKKDLKCNYCSKHFSTDWYFKIHVAMHSGEKPFTCRICQETFGNRYDMKKHLTSNHKNESIACDNCDFTCTSYALLDKHLKTHSTVEQSSKCSNQIKTNTATTKTKSECTTESEKIYKIENNYDNTNDSCNETKEKCINGTTAQTKSVDSDTKSIKQAKQNKFSLGESNNVKANGIYLLPLKN